MENKKINFIQSKRANLFSSKAYNINLTKYIKTLNKNNDYNFSQRLKNNTLNNPISDYYYKNPFFYNDKNLNIQLKILKNLKNSVFSRNYTPTTGNTNINTKHTSMKSLNDQIFNNEKIKINISSYNNKAKCTDKLHNMDLPNILRNKDKDNIKIEINESNEINENKLITKNYSSVDNFSSSEKYSSNNMTSINTPRKIKLNDEYFYKIIFKTKRLFKSEQKVIIDNKFNMIYAENEDQYQKIIDKEYNKLISKGKKVKSKNVSQSIKLKLKEAKNRIKFMKGILDYSYPGIVLYKIKLMQKKLNEHKNNAYYLNSLNGMEKRNKEKNERNIFRKEYLLKSITLYK